MNDYSQEILEILGNIHLFDSLDEHQLNELSEQLDTVFFKQNEIIFEQGSQPDGFYIVLSGRVTIQLETDDDPFQLSICQKGDYFGEEGLIHDQNREVTAQAITNAILIHINKHQVEEIFETHPEVIEPAHLSVKSYNIFLKHPFAWRAPREAVHFVARKHGIFLWFGLIPPVVLGSISILFFIYFIFLVPTLNTWLLYLLALLTLTFVGWFVWKLIDWSNDFSIVTNRRIVSLEKVALFYESRQEAPLDAILAVEIKSSQLGRWLGYGDIVIRTFTGVINFKNLANPELVIRLINDEKGRASYQSNKLGKISKEKILRSRIGFEPNQTEEYPEESEENEINPTDVPPLVESSNFIEFLSSFFGLRMEKSGTLIYRTHWYILLKKVIWPSLSFLLIILTVVYSIFEFYPSINFGTILLIQAGIGLVIFMWWLYQYWDWRNDRYIVTDDQIIDVYKKPLGQEQRRSAPIKNIQTVEFERLGIISLILNFGTVFIRVGDTTFTFDYVFNPSKVQQDVFERYQKYMQNQKQKEKDALRNEVAEWLEIYHEVVQKKSKSTDSSGDQEISGYNIGDY